MKKTKLVWRLGKLPSPQEVSMLVNDKIITQEEAREVLFSSETTEERDENSLKAEIKFLRELVDKLAQKKTDRIIEVIREVQPHYKQWEWHKPYMSWSTSPSIPMYYSGGTSTLTNIVASSGGTASSGNASFSSINTF